MRNPRWHYIAWEVMQIDADTHTTLTLGIARLRSMRAIECLSALLAAAALASATVLSTSEVTRALLALSLIAASVATYSCIRVRIDVTLFERWEQLDVAALDHALLALNPRFNSGRSLHSRIEGSVNWWRRGLGALAIQLALCVCAILWI